MAGQTLRNREITRAIDAILKSVEKPTIDVIRLRLRALGYIVSDEEAVVEWERVQTRAMVQMTRKAHVKAGEIEDEPIHLFETLEDGTKQDYWRPQGILTEAEAIQDTLYWLKRRNYCDKQVRRKVEYHSQRLGDAYQNRLPLDIFEEVT